MPCKISKPPLFLWRGGSGEDADDRGARTDKCLPRHPGRSDGPATLVSSINVWSKSL